MNDSTPAADPGRPEPTTEFPAAAPTAPMPAEGPPQGPAGTPHPGPVAGFPFATEPPEHPQTMTILILGIVGLAGVWITAPIAWYLGQQALKEIDAAPGQYSKREMVNIGRILGMVGTILLIVVTLFFIVYIGFFIVLAAGTAATT